jgi:hypothetical protein
VAQTVEQVLKDAKLYTDEQPYTLVKLPAAAIVAGAAVLAEIGEPFGALIADKDEVTLLIPADVLPAFASRLPDHVVGDEPYRLITFDLELEPTLTGFMAVISAALAKAGVPILPIAAFSRDHILVPAAKFEAALAALQQLLAPPTA